MIEYENLRKSNETFFEQYKEILSKVLNSGRFILGDHVAEFEQKFAEFCGVKHCVGLASGLDALTLAIDAFEFPPGSEIIVPSNTYIATIMAILRNGFKPVLVEPDLRTYNIDPQKIQHSITGNTRAIIVVHLYGKCCDMTPVIETARRYNLVLIEDVAQAHGAKYKGKKAGSFGVGCFSFYPTKNLGALGDAGAITVDDDALADKIRSLRNYGSKTKHYNELLGYNSRLDELQAAFLLVKLKALDTITFHKRNLAGIYLSNLSDRFIKPLVHEDFFDVYHIFNIRHKDRDKLREYLLKNGIGTEIHYPLPPHRQKAMMGLIDGMFPLSNEIHETTLSLPISYYHSPEEIHSVCQTINQWPG